MQKTGKCEVCGAYRILKKSDMCKKCNSFGIGDEEEE